MKHDNWIDDLQKRMAQHQEPVETDLWTGIEKQLTNPPYTKHATHISLWRRYAAAAVICIALLGGAAYVLFHQQTSTPSLAVQTSRQPSANANQQTYMESKATSMAQEQQPTTALTPLIATTVSNTGQSTAAASQAKLQTQREETLLANVSKDVASADNSATSQPSVETYSSAEPATQQPNTQAQSATTTPTAQATDKQVAQRSRTYATHHHTTTLGHNSTLSMNLYASNALMNYSTSNPIHAAQPVMMYNDYFMSKAYTLFADDVSPILNQTHEEVVHHQPISLGLSFSVPLHSRLSVSTGVVYTKLQSDFIQTMGTTRFTTQQTLHYVGVPLNISYAFWQNKHLRTYAMAGGQVDFNVKAQNTKEGVTQDIKKTAQQWSTQAALGIQYNVTPHLGAYLEPGLKYYIPQHQPLNTYWKDKPLQFNLQIGVRWQY